MRAKIFVIIGVARLLLLRCDGRLPGQLQDRNGPQIKSFPNPSLMIPFQFTPQIGQAIRTITRDRRRSFQDKQRSLQLVVICRLLILSCVLIAAAGVYYCTVHSLSMIASAIHKCHRRPKRHVESLHQRRWLRFQCTEKRRLVRRTTTIQYEKQFSFGPIPMIVAMMMIGTVVTTVRMIQSGRRKERRRRGSWRGLFQSIEKGYRWLLPSFMEETVLTVPCCGIVVVVLVVVCFQKSHGWHEIKDFVWIRSFGNHITQSPQKTSIGDHDRQRIGMMYISQNIVKSTPLFVPVVPHARREMEFVDTISGVIIELPPVDMRHGLHHIVPVGSKGFGKVADAFGC